ncbi:AMP-binding protein [Aquipuribacter sp. MA13-6]|uniref:AMP-binding protein n=1 Tax=unclassified Aquipuribacter TaxID=2635084 RepID=UPI003EEA5A1C
MSTDGVPPRAVQAVPVTGADGLVLLDPLRAAMSGAGPAVHPHAAGTTPAPTAVAPLATTEDDSTDPVAAVVSTTGSSGTAKHVLLPASALLASAAAAHDHLGGAGRWLLALPAHTVAGVQVVVRSLVAGTRPEVMDLTAGFDAAGFVAAASTMSVPGARPGRRYTSLVPTQLRRLLDAEPSTGAAAALRGFDAVLVGGAALDPALRRRADDAGVRVVATYGMTETCGGCVYDGVALPGVEVSVVAPTGDGPGRVVLSGSVVARGYRRGPAVAGSRVDGSEAACLTGEDPDGEGFAGRDRGRRSFRTADRGELVDGRLVLHGRMDDVVVSGGVNVALDAVARCVLGLPGVADCLAVGVPDPEWGRTVAVLVQPQPGSTGPSPEALRAAVRAALGRAAVPRTVLRVQALPLTGVGKPDRAAAVRVVLQGPRDAARPGLGDDVGPSTHRPEEPTA